jgi:hypothetical protein
MTVFETASSSLADARLVAQDHGVDVTRDQLVSDSQACLAAPDHHGLEALDWHGRTYAARRTHVCSYE